MLSPVSAVLILCVLVIVLAALTILIFNCSSNLVLVWSDEFDGKAGSAPDATYWTCETGGGGFGNDELEVYTSSPENVCQDGHSNLVITARKETVVDPDGVTRRYYTSARINTLGKFGHKYGRVEGRIRIPEGQGIWPAFWLMGVDIAAVGWPACGEIDVMEVVKDAGVNHGTVHGPGYSGAGGIGGQYKLPEGQKLSDDFHIYAVDWEPNAIHFLLDGNRFFSVSTADLNGKRWVYDHPFFILLNVAVGGNWPGNPDETTEFPVTMLVDYVRVYRKRHS